MLFVTFNIGTKYKWEYETIWTNERTMLLNCCTLLIKFLLLFLFLFVPFLFVLCMHAILSTTIECWKLGRGSTATYTIYCQICVRWIHKRGFNSSGFHNSYIPICDHCHLLPARSLSQSFGIQKTYWTSNGWGYYLVKGAGHKNAWITRCSWTAICLQSGKN